jgi:catechol 2,3-dioxygenase-like lactoylglutathione lyase family enzyme
MLAARELRFAFVVEDYDAALRVFRDVLGLETIEELERQGGRGVILRVPEATFELFDVAHGDLVDEIETGRPLGVRVRIAVRVDDLEEASAAVRAAGAEVVAPPVDTPWGDRNQRLDLPGAMQLTLFRAP